MDDGVQRYMRAILTTLTAGACYPPYIIFILSKLTIINKLLYFIYSYYFIANQLKNWLYIKRHFLPPPKAGEEITSLFQVSQLYLSIFRQFQKGLSFNPIDCPF